MNLETKIQQLINYYYVSSKTDLYTYINISNLFSFFILTQENFKEETVKKIHEEYSRLSEYVEAQLLKGNLNIDEQNPLFIFIQKITQSALSGKRIKNTSLCQKLSNAYLNILLKEKQLKEGIIIEYNYCDYREIEAIKNLYQNLEPDELVSMIDMFYDKIIKATNKTR